MDNHRFADKALLIRSCIARDYTAWDFFTKKYSGLIFTAINRRLRKYGIYPKADDLREIQQNILSALWEGGKFAEIRNPESLDYWLAVVSGNIALRHMQRQAATARIAPLSLSESVGDAELADLLPSGAPTPQEEMARSELAGKIEEEIEALPQKERLILKLNLLHGKMYDEIALILGVPRGTVSSCVKRAKDKLRKKLRGHI